MRKISLTVLFLVGVLMGCTGHFPINLVAQQCFENKDRNYSAALNCYRDAHEKLPLQYSQKSSAKLGNIEKRTYELTSPTWMAGAVTPEQWRHKVDIYIPQHALKQRALLVINNGINTGYDKNLPKPPSDYSEASLLSLAAKTNTITISISDVPNQYLHYQDTDIPKREDDLIAHSWKLFLDAPDKETFASVHIPMMEAVVKVMDLAQREVKMDRFIVTGASKRGWATWLTALTDKRIDAIVPFVIDILNTKQILKHEYATYGKGWPMAFGPYFKEGITAKLDTPAFEQLMEIEDPLHYLNGPEAERLAISKYIVNASGDDFFVPDNAQLYFDQLPGPKILRMAPNSNHYGISQFIESSLVPFVNRFQQSITLPVLTTYVSQVENKTKVSISFSEQPVEVRRWSATNSMARDFRYSCGIKYSESSLTLDKRGTTVSVFLEQPEKGWTASFVEARFKDGLVVTSPVHITPDDIYPEQPAASSIPACQIIGG